MPVARHVWLTCQCKLRSICACAQPAALHDWIFVVFFGLICSFPTCPRSSKNVQISSNYLIWLQKLSGFVFRSFWSRFDCYFKQNKVLKSREIEKNELLSILNLVLDLCDTLEVSKVTQTTFFRQTWLKYIDSQSFNLFSQLQRI